MDWAEGGGGDRPAIVDWIAQEVEDATEGFLADRHGHRRAGIGDIGPAPQAIRRAQRDRANPAAAQVLLHFPGEPDRAAVDAGVDLEGIVNTGELIFGELSVEGGADDLGDFSGGGHK